MAVAFMAAGGLVTVAGCGPSDPFNRQPVTGTVTLKGKPVAYGQIFFEPLDNQGVGTNAEVKDGKFELAKKEGLSPGKYRWMLSVLDRIPTEPGGADTGPAPKNLVPAKDNGKDFEVKAGAENKLDIVIP
jgi:hypothetical protein